MFFKLNITRAKIDQGAKVRRSAALEALEDELQGLQSYLYSDKFARDTTVQVRDITTRLAQLQVRADRQGDQAADRFFTDLKVDLVKKAMARQGYPPEEWELKRVAYPHSSWPEYVFRHTTNPNTTVTMAVEWRYMQ